MQAGLGPVTVNVDQILVFATFGGAMLLFVWGRFRYDLGALFAVLFVAVARVVPPANVFFGVWPRGRHHGCGGASGQSWPGEGRRG